MPYKRPLPTSIVSTLAKRAAPFRAPTFDKLLQQKFWPHVYNELPGSGKNLDRLQVITGTNTKLMVIMDSSNGKVVSTVPIGGRVDANAFDPGTQLAFSSSGEGNVTIAHEDGPDKLTVVQTLTTEPGARTMALDPKTHNIYLASAKFDSASEPGKRPQMVPGSFKILVYAIGKGH